MATAESTSTTLAKKPVKKAATKKAATKKAVTKKPAAKTAAKKGVLVEPDLISTTATELENLKPAEAFKMVAELAENVDYTYFKLGGVLSVIQSNGWYTDEGYETFRGFVETEYGINYRKAMYLVAIYNGLVESGVSWDKVKDIGWTKLKELANIITEDTVDKWVKAAKEMTVIQLIEYIKEDKKGSAETSDDGKGKSPSTDVKSMTFKLHADQREIVEEAIEKAKGEADTEYPAVALEAVCLSFLNAGTKKPAKTKVKTVPMAEQMEKAGWEAVLETFEKIWPDIDLTVEP